MDPDTDRPQSHRLAFRNPEPRMHSLQHAKRQNMARHYYAMIFEKKQDRCMLGTEAIVAGDPNRLEVSKKKSYAEYCIPFSEHFAISMHCSSSLDFLDSPRIADVLWVMASHCYQSQKRFIRLCRS